MRALIFDLDDTLYPERRFLLSGFAAVAREVERIGRVPACLAFRNLVASFRVGRRADAFQRLCASHSLDESIVPRLLAVYRQHLPCLRMPRSTRRVLEAAREEFRVAVLTNGAPAVQRRKVAALDLERSVDAVIYADEHGEGRGKPDPAVFLHALATLGATPREAVMVGNDPACDIAGGRGAGLRTIRLCSGGDRPRTVPPGLEADIVVSSLSHVPAEARRLLQGKA